MIFIVFFSPRKIGSKFWGGGGDLLNWILNGWSVYMGEAYNKAINLRDSITFSKEIGNNIEKKNE